VSIQSRHPELVSGSSHCDDESSPLTPTLSCTSLRIQAHKTRSSSVRFASRRARGKRAAFTLAEVLITLAIIGVVAAMTIPTLMTNFQKKVTAVKVKKAYAELVQAIKLSQIDNGNMEAWDFTPASNWSSGATREFIAKYIAPYFNSLTECSVGKDYSCGFPVSGYGVNYILKNGVGISFIVLAKDENDPNCPTNTIHFVVTVTPKDSYILGRDAFYFEIVDGKVQPAHYRSDLTREDVMQGYTINDGRVTVACRKDKFEDDKSGVTHRDACTMLFYLDGFEFKDDYPW